MLRECGSAVLMLAAGLMLAGCASQRGGVAVPPDALVVATVRHTAGPQRSSAWIARADLPRDTQRSDGERALLLEVGLQDGGVQSVELAPLELANLLVRVEARDANQTVIAIDNATEARLAYDLFVSPDGERFRYIPSCPVIARGHAFERWPERARWIAIANVRVAGNEVAGCD